MINRTTIKLSTLVTKAKARKTVVWSLESGRCRPVLRSNNFRLVKVERHSSSPGYVRLRNIVAKASRIFDMEPRELAYQIINTEDGIRLVLYFCY
jgi:hypothetical protein